MPAQALPTYEIAKGRVAELLLTTVGMVDLKLTECKSLTGIDLLVRGNTICIHYGLKATSELVHLVVGRRLLRGLHAVQDGGNRRPATFLHIHVHGKPQIQ